MPTARGTLGVAAASNGKIYAIGGCCTPEFIATVEEYDPATDTWTARASMPTARNVLGVVAASNGKIYAIGGWGDIEFLTTVEEYDPATNTWTARASMPTARDDLSVATASNGKIYAIGGYNGTPLATVEEYDPETDTWTARASMPTARIELGVAAASNGKIYAIGGINGTPLATVEEYDPETDTWTARANMPTARVALGVAAASNGKIYAIGGYNGTPLATVEEYDPGTDTWTARASMPTARDYLGVAADSNGKIYAIGGEFLSTVEEWRVPFRENNFYETGWLSNTHYRAYEDITSRMPRHDFTLAIEGAAGLDGIEIAPNTSFTFTVDYAARLATRPLRLPQPFWPAEPPARIHSPPAGQLPTRKVPLLASNTPLDSARGDRRGRLDRYTSHIIYPHRSELDRWPDLLHLGQSAQRRRHLERSRRQRRGDGRLGLLPSADSAPTSKRIRSAQRTIHRCVHRRGHIQVLGLRRWRDQQPAKPVAHLRLNRNLHRHPGRQRTGWK